MNKPFKHRKRQAEPLTLQDTTIQLLVGCGGGGNNINMNTQLTQIDQMQDQRDAKLMYERLRKP